MITNLVVYGVEENDKKSIYKLTKSPKIKKVSEIEDGTILHLKAIAFFTDVNEERETETDITSVLTNEDIVYATNSATFKRELKDILLLMDSSDFTIEKMSGTSKNSREYVTCSLI